MNFAYPLFGYSEDDGRDDLELRGFLLEACYLHWIHLWGEGFMRGWKQAKMETWLGDLVDLVISSLTDSHASLDVQQSIRAVLADIRGEPHKEEDWRGLRLGRLLRNAVEHFYYGHHWKWPQLVPSTKPSNDTTSSRSAGLHKLAKEDDSTTKVTVPGPDSAPRIATPPKREAQEDMEHAGPSPKRIKARPVPTVAGGTKSMTEEAPEQMRS